ncbi:MAG TPA: NnrS family protein, partial [Burkholderiaceae bacterium]
MSTFIPIDEPRRPAAAPAGFALWQLGFRPFYLLASVFAALSIGLWAAQVAGWLSHPYLAGPLWHAHEMLFGFTLAVVVGFLLTAGRNWSNRPTLTGVPLAALALLWVAGRVLVLTPFGWAAAIVDAAFPFAAAAALAVPFWAARNRRNYFFVGLLVLLGAADLAIHLSQLGVLALPAWLGLQIALDMVLFIMAVMAGRVIPMFTNNGVPGAGATRHAAVEKAALGSVLALLAADLLGLH